MQISCLDSFSLKRGMAKDEFPSRENIMPIAPETSRRQGVKAICSNQQWDGASKHQTGNQAKEINN